MKRLFAVTRTRGDAWDASHPLEGQQAWDAHAVFMNQLARDGFVVLGGPLEGTPDALIIMRAETPEEIMERLASDPWTKMHLLRVSRLAPWQIRLGSLPPE